MFPCENAGSLDFLQILFVGTHGAADWSAMNLRGHLHKALPPVGDDLDLAAAGACGWRALDGDLWFPVLVLKEAALRHNQDVMARYCAARGVRLAPHGKTTMSPQLVRRQLEGGAWGITAANPAQARAMRAFGATRVVIANQVPDPAGIRWVAREMAANADVEILSLVDSEAGVEILREALEGARVRLPVLVEMGIEGQRTGCRTVEEGRRVAAAVLRAPGLRLAGVEGFEGVLGHDPTPETLARVDAFLGEVRRLTEELAAQGAFADAPEILVTAGGSAYFDRVVRVLGSGWQLDRPVALVLRSGCYLTHDHGDYGRVSPLGARDPEWPQLRPALEVWGLVHSRPEPGLALVGFGKRDVSYDVALPVPLWVRSRRGEAREAPAAMQVTKLNDQHAFVRLPEDDALAVGDRLGCGLAHPCTVFDKWRVIPVVDEDYRVLEVVETAF